MRKRKIIYIQGTWDLFHIGHLNILRNAHKMGEKLVVGVNTDNSVREYKGSYPIIVYHDRVKMLKACRYVDIIIKSEFILNIDKLKKHKIEVLVLPTGFIDQSYLNGANKAEEIGVKIIYLPYTKTISTTMIKNKIREMEV